MRAPLRQEHPSGVRRTGWKLGCLTSFQIVTAHYDEVVASSRSQESLRSACAGVMIGSYSHHRSRVLECFAASCGYWRLIGGFEQFVGVTPRRCRRAAPLRRVRVRPRHRRGPIRCPQLPRDRHVYYCFRGFVLVRRECVRVGGGPKASLALGLTRPVCPAPVPVDLGVPPGPPKGRRCQGRRWVSMRVTAGGRRRSGPGSAGRSADLQRSVAREGHSRCVAREGRSRRSQKRRACGG